MDVNTVKSPGHSMLTPPAAPQGHASPANTSVGPGSLCTHPMHPEVRVDRPGNCPECGMTLGLVMPAASEDEGENAELNDF